ncbi:MAG TPA: BamA/TamA family outer membrane protein [Chryseolinea sp.]|nr:BamA/TamA family outer membrane protein [Chryseolinea sp.]HPM29639.1 BamA/TamA family outer membrane protein [Chryseolinea sp.]
MRHLLLFILILYSWFTFGQQSDSTQVDLVDVFLGKKSRTTTNQVRSGKKVHFSILPAAVNVPGGGRAVITAANAAFYLGDPDSTNLSNVYLIPYTNLTNRYGLYIRPNLWLAKNSFNILGDYRVAHFPQYSWGLGGDSPEWDRSLIDADYLRFYQYAYKKIYRNWYAGLGYAWDYYYNIDETEFEGTGHLERYGQQEYSSTVSSGLTFSIKLDARENAINPQGGSYLLLTWRWNSEGLGSTFTNSSLFIDGRKYLKMSKTRDNIIAFRSYYWSVLAGETPYLDLPATNWAPATGISGRGFQSGRYRSNAMIYAEGEQRVQLTDNGLVGMVAFMNITSASELDTQHFQHWQVGGGFGLRTKFNKYSDTNIAIDFGFSANYWGVWLNIGEVF